MYINNASRGGGEAGRGLIDAFFKKGVVSKEALKTVVVASSILCFLLLHMH